MCRTSLQIIFPEVPPVKQSGLRMILTTHRRWWNLFLDKIKFDWTLFDLLNFLFFPYKLYIWKIFFLILKLIVDYHHFLVLCIILSKFLRSINENKKTRRNISNMKSDEKTISSLNRKSVGNCRSVDYIAFIREKINKISSLMRYIRSESKWKSNWIYMSWRILVFFFIAPILIRISYSYIPFKTALLI